MQLIAFTSFSPFDIINFSVKTSLLNVIQTHAKRIDQLNLMEKKNILKNQDRQKL